jgi:hypothetical protein
MVRNAEEASEKIESALLKSSDADDRYSQPAHDEPSWVMNESPVSCVDHIARPVGP